jgi:hypothetical protein
MLHQFIHEALRGYKASKKSCSCGCGGCSDSQPKLALLESKTPISEGLRYHIDNGISLQENVFRIGSKKYLQLFAEARMLHEWGNISLDENSKFLIENTDIGKFGVYEDKKVPLDLPCIMENSSGPLASTHPWAYGPDNNFGQFTYSDEIESLAKMIADKMGGKVEGYGLTDDGEILVATKGMDYIVDRQGNIKDERQSFTENKKKKKDPPLGKPKRGGSKAYYVYVRDPKTKNIKKVSFGSGGLRAKIKNPKARSAFAARHDCKNKKDRTKASYWSCNLPRYAPALGLGPKMNTYW